MFMFLMSTTHTVLEPQSLFKAMLYNNFNTFITTHLYFLLKVSTVYLHCGVDEVNIDVCAALTKETLNHVSFCQ